MFSYLVPVVELGSAIQGGGGGGGGAAAGLTVRGKDIRQEDCAQVGSQAKF